MTFSRVGIVGAGTMGRGIAQAISGVEGVRVILVDRDSAALDAALSQLARDYNRLVTKGVLDPEEKEKKESALATTDDVADLSSCDLVIEAVPEILDLKLTVLSAISAAVPSSAVIASNTSSIPITRLSRAIEGPTRFFGIHFFNPAPRMPLVEVIRTVHSDPSAEARILSFLREAVAKEPVAVDDRPGFVVNALLVPYLLSAARMLDAGYATADQIDTGMRLGAGHPMGPLALSDMIGLDVIVDAADAMYTETRDPAFIVPNTLRRRIDAGMLGRKSGRGFFAEG